MSFPPKMKHAFIPSQHSESDVVSCAQCGYAEVSHTDKAECEACGSICECGFFPDHKHPKKILVCYACYDKEIKLAVTAASERQRMMTAANVVSPAAYFVSESPSIKEIVDSINSDESIQLMFKNEKICEVIKERILNYQKNILTLNQEVRDKQKQLDEARVYLNHKMKEISAEAIQRLGLQNINYKPPTAKEGKVKITKAPSTKKVDMNELKKMANMYNVPAEAIRNVMLARGLPMKDAVDVCIKIFNSDKQVTTN